MRVPRYSMPTISMCTPLFLCKSNRATIASFVRMASAFLGGSIFLLSFVWKVCVCVRFPSLTVNWMIIEFIVIILRWDKNCFDSFHTSLDWILEMCTQQHIICMQMRNNRNFGSPKMRIWISRSFRWPEPISLSPSHYFSHLVGCIHSCDDELAYSSPSHTTIQYLLFPFA